MLPRLGGAVDTFALFVAPRAIGTDWSSSDLRRAVERTPGVTVLDDIEGVEAQRFGATTSGTTLLFDARGHLAFNGGITAMRGHEGVSFGEERIVALVTGGRADRNDSPVFGCGLTNDTSENRP